MWENMIKKHPVDNHHINQPNNVIGDMIKLHQCQYACAREQWLVTKHSRYQLIVHLKQIDLTRTKFSPYRKEGNAIGVTVWSLL